MTEHKSLHAAVLAFQSEIKALPKDATNPHFKSKFTPLDTIVEHVQPLLAKHGLTWMTFPCFGPQGEPALSYKLTHTGTGESEQDVMPLLVAKNDPQGLGSALTYGRRYSISAVLNLISDEDDDGNQAARAGQQSQSHLASEGQRRLIMAKWRDANIPPSELAAIINDAAGGDPQLWETEEAAQSWIDRALPKLPSRLVTGIAEKLDHAGVTA